MKKFAIFLLALIIVLAIILYLKINGNIPPTPETPISSSSPYSSEDIEKLILKGQETLDNENNVYYEIHTEGSLTKYYYKDAKSKSEFYLEPSSIMNVDVEEKVSTVITDLDVNKVYRFNHIQKSKSEWSTQQSANFAPHLSLIDYVNLQAKFIYVNDEKFEGKDCILFKVFCYDKKTNELDLFENEFVNAYWLEKSTGLVIGGTSMQAYGNNFRMLKDNVKSYSVIKNLSFGTVTDSDLVEPSL